MCEKSKTGCELAVREKRIAKCSGSSRQGRLGRDLDVTADDCDLGHNPEGKRGGPGIVLRADLGEIAPRDDAESRGHDL